MGKGKKEKFLHQASVKLSKNRKRLVMATAKEIREHLEIAIKEVGRIKPWFDSDVREWIFKHPRYPVEYGGNSSDEVIKNYPKYLREFIKNRLNNRLNPLTEKKTKGHGGKRKGAGRPKGSAKEASKRISLPMDIAEWISQPGTIMHLRALGLMSSQKSVGK